MELKTSSPTHETTLCTMLIKRLNLSNDGYFHNKRNADFHRFFPMGHSRFSCALLRLFALMPALLTTPKGVPGQKPLTSKQKYSFAFANGLEKRRPSGLNLIAI